MSSIKICKCGSLASWNSYFGGYYCHNCGLILEDGLPDGGRGGHLMDYDKLIEHLRECGTYGFKQEECRDAALAIKALRAELARVTAERDAAIEDLEEIMFKGGHNIDTCHFCTNGQCYGRGGTQVCNPVWRGTGAVIEKNWVDHKGAEGPEGKED